MNEPSSSAGVGMREQRKETGRPGKRRVALVTYSTKPRGGVVHTLSLAEAMVDQAMDVRLVGLGDPDEGFFRPVRAPYILVPTSPPADTLEKRVFASIRRPGGGALRGRRRR